MNIGTDKFAHTGISAMLVAMLSVILVIQDAAPSWDYLLFSLIVALVVFIFGLFKEYAIDDKPDRGDIIADAVGCLAIPLAVLAGTLFSILSH